MKLPDLLLRLDDLYSRYLDVRLAALTGGNIIRSSRVEDRLVVTLACASRPSVAPCGRACGA